MTDISSRADIARLVDSFYDRIRADARLGPIFDDVAHVDWETHLPRMYTFWEAVLFGVPGFRGNPMAAHIAVDRQETLSADDFARWLALFHATVDDLFDGPVALVAKQRASQIALSMQARLAMAREMDTLPLVPNP